MLWEKKPEFDVFVYRGEAGSPTENFYQVDKHAFEESENCLISTARPINIQFFTCNKPKL